MIYDPPKDYYKLCVGTKTIGIFPFTLDSNSERVKAYQAARDLYDRSAKALDLNGKTDLRIVRWANGNLFQSFPDARPALQLVGTNLADG